MVVLRVEFDIGQRTILRKISLARRMYVRRYFSATLQDSHEHFILPHAGLTSSDFAVVSSRGDIVLHDIRNGSEVFRLDGGGGTFISKIPPTSTKRLTARPVILDKEGCVICSTDEDQAVRIWDYHDGEELYKITPRGKSC